MGGDLTVESELGKGSTFTLWLPAAGSADAAEMRHVAREQTARSAMLIGIAEQLHRDMSAILRTHVARLRADPEIPKASTLSDAELEDHAASFLADVIQSLDVIGESGGDVSPLIRDGTEIQTLIASRHGAQRFRLGWTEEQLHREFRLLSEEMRAAIERAAPPGELAALNAASAILDRLLEFGEHVSVRGFHLAAAAIER
jgi:hypothetical protein